MTLIRGGYCCASMRGPMSDDSFDLDSARARRRTAPDGSIRRRFRYPPCAPVSRSPRDDALHELTATTSPWLRPTATCGACSSGCRAYNNQLCASPAKLATVTHLLALASSLAVLVFSGCSSGDDASDGRNHDGDHQHDDEPPSRDAFYTLLQYTHTTPVPRSRRWQQRHRRRQVVRCGRWKNH